MSDYVTLLFRNGKVKRAYLKQKKGILIKLLKMLTNYEFTTKKRGRINSQILRVRSLVV